MKHYLQALVLLLGLSVAAQSSIRGTIKNGQGQPVTGANIHISDESKGTISDGDGQFQLSTSKKPPFTLEIKSMGFGNTTYRVTNVDKPVTITLEQEETKLNEVVVSASRTPERILESPVTVERMSLQEIKKTTSVSYYDGLENLKEVHFNTSSMSFKSINTRGFATIANNRFMQLVDGMDNSSPALNFPLGNLIGMSELDVQSVELLPGASSALYGANAFNGILFMNSKSPFQYQGVSTYFKYGQTHQELAGTNDYWDFGVRAAKAFTKHFAVKANFTYMKAKEWMAGDLRDVRGGAEGYSNNMSYDGLNIYGDEARTNIKDVGRSLVALGVIPAGSETYLPNNIVGRTGYEEKYLTDNNIHSAKADFAMHFKPFANDFEVILQHKLGFGNTIYQGGSRYMLKDFYMYQNRIEVKGKNFFVRAYQTNENAGNSYDMQSTALNINRLWKADNLWFGQYAGSYVQGKFNGLSDVQANIFARSSADSGRIMPGTPEFQSAFNSVIANPDLKTGSKFLDRSSLYHVDYNYNFKDLVKPVEIMVGGSYRQYTMDSQGTIFTDFDGPLKYSEYGMYTQAQKKLMDDRLKLTGSVRYDKSQNFNGQFSPRVAAVYSAGAKKNHNFRVSFQTGFRNPTTQDQYIGLNIGAFALIGSAPDNLSRYSEVRDVSFSGQAYTPGNAAQVTLNGFNAYNNSYTSTSVDDFRRTGDASLLQKSTLSYVKPEQVKAIEIGYKAILLDNLMVDINGYYNIYNDFMTTARVYAPYYGDIVASPATTIAALTNGDARLFQVYSNSASKVTSVGFGVGASKKVYKNYELGINYTHAQFKAGDEDPSFISYFNTPKHRLKASLSNTNVFRNFGFGVNWRWSDSYLWESSFAIGNIPSVSVFDAQMSYAIPSMKSVIKVTGSNLGGKDYLQVLGAGRIGQQLLVSLTINP
ncbi:MAG: hypothetical protein CFE24_10560 [Flavobacterium sp. BFFFF2]|nr:MAG: hypothetical protein CFE24_10560 [Flavobacterium sp. BFFFF2]